MKIALLNLEPKYTNYALEKIRIYHINKGDKVENYFPLKYEDYDKIYCSSIFQFTPKLNLPPNAICGGTGFDLTTKLPDEIEQVKPHLNFGFTTRGCVRHCSFCVVPQKEGNIRIVGDLLDLWDGKSKEVILHDNNILALPKHFEKICKQAADNHIRLDFNQGLDHRLLNQHIVDIMKSISHKEYKFSFDSVHSYLSVSKAIALLQKNGIKCCEWFVLVGYDTTFKQDLDRINFLRANNQDAYVQKYTRDKKYSLLALWVNQHGMYRFTTWEQFMALPQNEKYKDWIK